MALEPRVWSHRGWEFKKQEKNVHWASRGHETQFSSKFGAKTEFALSFLFLSCFNQSLLLLQLSVVWLEMFPSLVHLTLSLSISYPDLIKFHDFADNSQEGMKHQMRDVTQTQQGMTLPITLIATLYQYHYQAKMSQVRANKNTCQVWKNKKPHSQTSLVCSKVDTSPMLVSTYFTMSRIFWSDFC